MRLLSVINVAVAAFWARQIHASSFTARSKPSQDNGRKVGQTVKTSSGLINGHPAPNRTDVSEYLGIPYAQPPIDKLRWQPPVKLNDTVAINALRFGFACMQATPLLSAADTGDLGNLTEPGASLVQTYIKPEDNSSIILPQSEDCLTLNIWTKPQVGDQAKAVLVWIHGGSFTSGSSLEGWYDGQYIAEEQDIVLVSINYRLNIFGFPGDPLTSANLGIQDQRIALEWIRDNIAGFGGDSNRIVIFGQSAGAASVDIHSYAYASDPIAAGYIPESGTSTGFGLNAPPQAAHLWFEASKAVGCNAGPDDPQAVLDCMMNQTAKRLANNVPAIPLGDTNGLPFGPVIDGTLVFDDYDKRKPAARPMLIGNTDDESALFRYMVPGSAEGVPESYWNILNNQGFTCPAGMRASYNVLHGNPTWRYRWFGTFPNLVLEWFPTPIGAWHGSEIPSLFNQTPENDIPNTMNQIANGKYMRTAWATFAKDPKQGLTNFGWPEYSTKGNTLIQLAFNDTLGPNLNQGDAYDDTCRGIPKVTSDDTAAIGGGNMSAGGATVSSHGNDTEADPPIPLDWYKDCVTGFWLGYFCIL